MFQLTSMNMKVGFHFEDLSDDAVQFETQVAFKKCVVSEVMQHVDATVLARWRDLLGNVGVDHLPRPDAKTGHVSDQQLLEFVNRELRSHCPGLTISKSQPPPATWLHWSSKECSLNGDPPFGSWCKKRSIELYRHDNPWTLERAVEDFEGFLGAQSHAPAFFHRGRIDAPLRSQLTGLRIYLFLNWHVDDVQSTGGAPPRRRSTRVAGGPTRQKLTRKKTAKRGSKKTPSRKKAKRGSGARKKR